LHLFNVYVAVNADSKREKDASGESITDQRAKDFFKRMEEG
jgi:hypothetical protein